MRINDQDGIRKNGEFSFNLLTGRCKADPKLPLQIFKLKLSKTTLSIIFRHYLNPFCYPLSIPALNLSIHQSPANLSKISPEKKEYLKTSITRTFQVALIKKWLFSADVSDHKVACKKCFIWHFTSLTRPVHIFGVFTRFAVYLLGLLPFARCRFIHQNLLDTIWRPILVGQFHLDNPALLSGRNLNRILLVLA